MGVQVVRVYLYGMKVKGRRGLTGNSNNVQPSTPVRHEI